MHRARDAVSRQPPARVPQHLRSTALRGSKEKFGAGKNYVYPHDAPGHFAAQDYLPEGFKNEAYYEPSDQGYEVHIARRMASWWGEEESGTTDS